MIKEILFKFYTTGNKIYIDLYFLFISLFIVILLFGEYLNKKSDTKKLLIGFVFLSLASIAHILRRYTNINSLSDAIRLIIFFSLIILSLLNIFSSSKKKVSFNVKNLAVLSIFIGILGFILPLFGIIALVIGSIALHKIKVESLSKPPKYRLFAISGIILGLVVSLSFTFVVINTRMHYKTFKARSSAMFPTIKDNDKIIVDRKAYFNRSPERGDIIVFEFAYNEKNKLRCSRVVGLPGDNLQIKNGQLYINNEPAKSCGLNIPINYKNAGDYGKEEQKLNIPTDCYYVLNDNSLKNMDSRYFGFINKKDIYGKVVLVYGKNLPHLQIFDLLKKR